MDAEQRAKKRTKYFVVGWWMAFALVLLLMLSGFGSAILFYFNSTEVEPPKGYSDPVGDFQVHRNVKLVRVIDGDTIVVNIDGKEEKVLSQRMNAS